MKKLIETLENIDPTKPETTINLIKKCIDQIYDTDTVYTSQDYTPEELDEFISNMTEDQFNMIKNMVRSGSADMIDLSKAEPFLIDFGGEGLDLLDQIKAAKGL